MLWSLPTEHDFRKLKNHIATWAHAFYVPKNFKLKVNSTNFEQLKFVLFHHVVDGQELKKTLYKLLVNQWNLNILKTFKDQSPKNLGWMEWIRGILFLKTWNDK
jgi:hypothetical protein